MSVAMMVTVGVLMPVTVVAAAYGVVAVIYWWEKRSVPAPRSRVLPGEMTLVEGGLVRQRIRWP
ncbi:hypothetical protein [Nocardia sp. NPDC056000]|uniref:hypothetical protein n=1 Tax=Nocardia sp. NPDC056000 TaxID=3345674 RepID=UPI0035DF3FA3